MNWHDARSDERTDWPGNDVIRWLCVASGATKYVLLAKRDVHGVWHSAESNAVIASPLAWATVEEPPAPILAPERWEAQ